MRISFSDTWLIHPPHSVLQRILCKYACRLDVEFSFPCLKQSNFLSKFLEKNFNNNYIFMNHYSQAIAGHSQASHCLILRIILCNFVTCCSILLRWKKTNFILKVNKLQVNARILGKSQTILTQVHNMTLCHTTHLTNSEAPSDCLYYCLSDSPKSKLRFDQV